MSRLRVYWPDVVERNDEASYGPDDEPMIVSFCRAALEGPDAARFATLTRARSLHHNRCCPDCRHPVVEPLELQDAALGRNRLPIPGTSTLVGYRCARCRSEWPV